MVNSIQMVKSLAVQSQDGGVSPISKKSVAQDCTPQKLTPIHNELFT